MNKPTQLTEESIRIALAGVGDNFAIEHAYTVWNLIKDATAEEWGIEWDNLNGGSYVDAYPNEEAAERAYNDSYSGALQMMKRRVLAWEPSDG